MTHEAAFMAEILAYPEDDAPRLLLADWLDENGHPERGEFVRVQVALARPCPLGRSDAYHVDDVCGPCDALRRRERELLGPNALAWSDSIMETGLAPACFMLGVGVYGYGYIRWYFRRGFVEAVECTAADFLAHADALTAAAPLRQVRLTTWPEVRVVPGGLASGDYYQLDTRGRIGGLNRIVVMERSPNVDSRREAAARLLAAEWPWIDFTLPPVATASWGGHRLGDVASVELDIPEALRRLRDRIVRDA